MPPPWSPPGAAADFCYRTGAQRAADQEDGPPSPAADEARAETAADARRGDWWRRAPRARVSSSRSRPVSERIETNRDEREPRVLPGCRLRGRRPARLGTFVTGVVRDGRTTRRSGPRHPRPTRINRKPRQTLAVAGGSAHGARNVKRGRRVCRRIAHPCATPKSPGRNRRSVFC